MAIINSGRSKHSDRAMHLMRILFFVMARFDIALVAVHLPGKKNEAADALFFAQVPNAAKEPSVVPQEVLDMLVNRQPDWTSRDWRSLYTSIFQKVWPVQRSVRIRQGRPAT